MKHVSNNVSNAGSLNQDFVDNLPRWEKLGWNLSPQTINDLYKFKNQYRQEANNVDAVFYESQVGKSGTFLFHFHIYFHSFFFSQTYN